jgi:ligand-binding SRPBCC domain-containing protein
MLAHISTIFDCTAEQLWDALSRPASLRFVAAPLLHFEPLVAGDLDGEWVVGKTYALRLSLFGFLPACEHRITLVTIDQEANLIESIESGALSPVWNHTIRFQPFGDGRLHYSDKIEIRAGLLTGVVWAFAQVFYRHRQRRWRTLLRSKTGSCHGSSAAVQSRWALTAPAEVRWPVKF